MEETIKMKSFTVTDLDRYTLTESVELDINNWFKNNKNIEKQFIKQTQSRVTGWITVWYK